MDEAYFEEEEMGMEEDDSMRLYLDSADVQVGGRAGWSPGWQAAAVLWCTLLSGLQGKAMNTHFASTYGTCRSGPSGPRRGCFSVSCHAARAVERTRWWLQWHLRWFERSALLSACTPCLLCSP